MKGAFGALHWTPEVFWRSTLTEYMAGIDGFNMVNGADTKSEGPSDEDIEALVAKYG